MKVEEVKRLNLTVCMIYSNAFSPTYPAVVLTCVYIAIASPWQIAENTKLHLRPSSGI